MRPSGHDSSVESRSSFKTHAASAPKLFETPSIVFGTGLLHARAKRWDFPRSKRPYALLDAAVANGSVVFDTARLYGGGWCEEILGRWIKARRARDKVIIVAKGAHPDAEWRGRVNPADIRADFEASLRALAVDYVDVFMLHRDDPTVPVEVLMETLNPFVQGGLARALGASNWSHQRIQAANDYARAKGLAPLVLSSPHFSLAEMPSAPWPGCLSIAGPANTEARAWYQQTKMPVLAWSPLSGGPTAATHEDPLIRQAYGSSDNQQRWRRAKELAQTRGVKVAQVALAYLMSQPFPVHPVVSASTPERLIELCDARNLKLTAEELAWLESGAAR